MEPQQNSPGVWSGLQTRALSAIALLAIGLFCVLQGGIIFACLVILAAILMMKEWVALTEIQMLVLRLAGYPCVILPCACILWLRGLSTPLDPNLGFILVIAYICVISATDIGAYFTGKKFGRHKLAPTISPNKTWEGLGGGIGCAMVIGLFFSPYIHLPHSVFSTLIACLFIAVLAQIGDLFKSWIKRLAGVKDSGTLIPGHGGLLDRLDGYIFTAPVLAFIIHATGF
jgi:phosphatidate cytidylyltransferase